MRLLDGSSSTISAGEVVDAIGKLFAVEWASVIIEEGTNIDVNLFWLIEAGLTHLDAIQSEEKDNAIKQEISDFELIEDESATKTEQVLPPTAVIYKVNWSYV